MLPTNKTKPKDSLQDFTVLIYGDSKIGKCVAGSTGIYDPVRGYTQTLVEMVREKTGYIHTMKPGGVISYQTPSHFIENEPQQLYLLTTELGKQIEATANHPFLTEKGWVPLEKLNVGDSVAIVFKYPAIMEDDDPEIAASLTRITSLIRRDPG